MRTHRSDFDIPGRLGTSCSRFSQTRHVQAKQRAGRAYRDRRARWRREASNIALRYGDIRHLASLIAIIALMP